MIEHSEIFGYQQSREQEESGKKERAATSVRGQMNSAPLASILDSRGNDYGDYSEMAGVAQALKSLMNLKRGSLLSTQKESIELICTKMARLACGDPHKRDTWLDIAGYATLIADTLRRVGANVDPKETLK